MGDIKGSEEIHLEEIPAPDSLFKPLTFPHKLLYGPGPSNVSPRVLKMASLPVMGHMHADFWLVGNWGGGYFVIF